MFQFFTIYNHRLNTIKSTGMGVVTDSQYYGLYIYYDNPHKIIHTKNEFNMRMSSTLHYTNTDFTHKKRRGGDD